MSETQTSGVRISRKAFVQAVLVIFALMIVAGVLTRVVPAGQYARLDLDGREVIDATSFSYVERPNYPAWRWLTAPVEVLFAAGNLTVIAIILFIVLVGVAFAVMDHSGILKLAVGAIIRATGGRKYSLLLVITFFFMALGGFFGIFEEIIPLVPIVIALAYSLGWDSLTGMGMSVLATNVGFSMAVFNPFTIGVSHRLAGLPLFSGAGLRVIWFFIVYAILAAFLRRHARRVELRPEASPVYNEDQRERQRRGVFTFDEDRLPDPCQALTVLGRQLGKRERPDARQVHRLDRLSPTRSPHNLSP